MIQNLEFSRKIRMEKFEKIDLRIKEIGDKLKKVRKEKGHNSYENFAFDNELSRVQYWRMEKGTNFTIKNLLKILDIHKMSLKDFFKDID